MNWIKKLLGLKTEKQCAIHNVVCSASSEKKPNPYEWIWYRQGWSDTKIAKNNAKYWEFEIKNNGLTLP